MKTLTPETRFEFEQKLISLGFIEEKLMDLTDAELEAAIERNKPNTHQVITLEKGLPAMDRTMMEHIAKATRNNKGDYYHITLKILVDISLSYRESHGYAPQEWVEYLYSEELQDKLVEVLAQKAA